MRFLDYSSNPRVPLVLDLVRDLSRATEPSEVQRLYAAGLRQLQGPIGYVSLSTRGLGPGQYKITRMMTEDDPLEADRFDPWGNWHRMTTHTGGFFGRIVVGGVPVIAHEVYLRGDPVVGDFLAPYGSVMALPLMDEGKPLNWAVQLRREPEAFSVDDLEDYILRGNLVGGTVRHVQTAKKLRQASEQISREVQRIADIQRALLPQELPTVPGLSLAASYHTFDSAGGDIYDVVKLPIDSGHEMAREGDVYGVLIGDASGHGPSAAVVMAMLHAILNAFPGTPRSTADVLQHANEHLCAKRIEQSFVTAFLAGYRPRTRRLTYSRAGHNPPLVMSPGDSREITPLDTVGDVPLGILPGVRYESHQLILQPGQTVVFYTDGITEASSPSGAMFGEEGLRIAMRRSDGTPRGVIDCVQQMLDEHQAGQRASDDQTLLVAQVQQ